MLNPCPLLCTIPHRPFDLVMAVLFSFVMQSAIQFGRIMASSALATLFGPQFNIPQDFNTNFLMLVRWIHFLSGITWIGMLYFFNLVNVQFMKELDAATRGKVVPNLMPKAVFWFRWGAIVTWFSGFIYYFLLVDAEAKTTGHMPLVYFLVGWSI